MVWSDMPFGFLIELIVLGAYLLAAILFLPKIRHKMARRGFIVLGALLLLLVLLQVTALVYLAFNPITINLRFT